ncbi:hypothetical protein [Rhizobium gallicum]|uniref:hypothetical protein n=1 Tax=Rhizobium gallicum TaxID=56730 RepID=UPI001EF8953B|nr:hypothetical protein [Rhizobium gallicum]ULJ75930.1 hypothetical protein L2W42_25890 [Rhizobium gallicum]
MQGKGKNPVCGITLPIQSVKALRLPWVVCRSAAFLEDNAQAIPDCFAKISPYQSSEPFAEQAIQKHHDVSMQFKWAIPMPPAKQ